MPRHAMVSRHKINSAGIVRVRENRSIVYCARIAAGYTHLMNTTTNTTADQINTATVVVGARLLITKGCAARALPKNVTVRVLSVEELGSDYGHSVKVRIQPVNGFKSGQTFSFYARHINRLADSTVRMNDGNPSHVIEVRRASR